MIRPHEPYEPNRSNDLNERGAPVPPPAPQRDDWGYDERRYEGRRRDDRRDSGVGNYERRRYDNRRGGSPDRRGMRDRRDSPGYDGGNDRFQNHQDDNPFAILSQCKQLLRHETRNELESLVGNKQYIPQHQYLSDSLQRA